MTGVGFKLGHPFKLDLPYRQLPGKLKQVSALKRRHTGPTLLTLVLRTRATVTACRYWIFVFKPLPFQTEFAPPLLTCEDLLLT